MGDLIITMPSLVGAWVIAFCVTCIIILLFNLAGWRRYSPWALVFGVATFVMALGYLSLKMGA